MSFFSWWKNVDKKFINKSRTKIAQNNFALLSDKWKRRNFFWTFFVKTSFFLPFFSKKNFFGHISNSKTFFFFWHFSQLCASSTHEVLKLKKLASKWKVIFECGLNCMNLLKRITIKKCTLTYVGKGKNVLNYVEKAEICIKYVLFGL